MKLLLHAALALQTTLGTPRGPSFSVEDMRADLGVLRSVLAGAHPGFERFTTSDEWAALFGQADAGLTAPLGALDFHCLVATLIARVGCAHTFSFPPPGAMDSLPEGPLLPFDVRITGGRAFVFHDLSGEGTLPEAMELLAVDERPASKILASLTGLVWRDGANLTYPERVVEEGFRRLYAVRFGYADAYRVQLEIQGEPTLFPVAGQSDKEVGRTKRERYPAHAWPPRPGLTLAFSADGRSATLTVGNFSDAKSESFYAETFRTLRERAPAGLVLDLRWNGGGHDHLGALLCRYLVPEPFRFYEDLQWSLSDPALLEHVTFDLADWNEYAPFRFPDGVSGDPRRDPASLAALLAHYPATHPLLVAKTLAPMADVYGGPLVVLVNGRSASSGAEVPAILHANGRGTFVGEETGGAYQGVTAGILTRLTLPRSKIGVQVPLYRYRNAVDPARFQGGGLVPEVVVHARVEDLLSGRDPEMTRALAILAESR